MTLELMISIAIVLVAVAYFALNRQSGGDSDLGDIITQLKSENATLTAENTQLKTDLAVAQHTVAQNAEIMATWDKKFTEQAQIALSQTARTLSQNLLEDYTKASQQTTAENQQKFADTNKQLLDEFKSLSERVKSLNDVVATNTATVNTIELALSTPHSMGQASETILDNTLKSFGLRSDIDYTTQSSVAGDGGTLRPDAMVFLPNDTVMVIDSKASKFMMDTARSDTDTDMENAKSAFAKTMQNHLTSLTRKDYRTAVERDYKAHKNTPNPNVIMVMWVATDGLLEILRTTAPDIFATAQQHQIFITGPSGLWSAIGVASQKITLQTQSDNHQTIVADVGNLLDAVGTVVGHANAMGRGLKSANTAYDKLQKSVNSRLLPRSHKIVKLGAPSPTKPLPQRIGGAVDEGDVIVDESESPAPSQIG